MMSITEPGLHDMPNAAYHADPVPGGSLSSTGARLLLPPSCPAMFQWRRTHPRPDKKAFDIGSAAHDKILGGGPEIVVCDYDDWRTKAAKEEAAEIRARGAIPILPPEREQIDAMATAVMAHPFAGKLFEPGSGVGEPCLFAADEQTGVMLRGRVDWLPHNTGGRMILPDLKTARSAEPEKFMRSAADYGYQMQAAWYSDLVKALGLAGEVSFVFVVVETDPPHLVSVIQPDVIAMRIGALLNRRAIDLYARCRADDRWPGYADDVVLGSLPAYIERLYESELA